MWYPFSFSTVIDATNIIIYLPEKNIICTEVCKKSNQMGATRGAGSAYPPKLNI